MTADEKRREERRAKAKEAQKKATARAREKRAEARAKKAEAKEAAATPLTRKFADPKLLTACRRQPTQKEIELAVLTVGAGNYRDVARQRLGVSIRLWQHWLKEGKSEIEHKEEGKIKRLSAFGDFAQRIEIAEGTFHSSAVTDVAGSDDDRVKLEFLKCRFHKHYNKNPNAIIDDETGEREKIDARKAFIASLKQITGNAEDEYEEEEENK